MGIRRNEQTISFAFKLSRVSISEFYTFLSLVLIVSIDRSKNGISYTFDELRAFEKLNILSLNRLGGHNVKRNILYEKPEGIVVKYYDYSTN